MPSACDSVIEDIEDMVSFNDPTPQDRQSARKSIIPRFRKKKDGNHEELQADRSVKQLLEWYQENTKLTFPDQPVMDGFGTMSSGNNCAACLQYFFRTATTQEVLYIYFNQILFFKLIQVKKKKKRSKNADHIKVYCYYC